jgi:hypothetical protein
MSPDVSAMWSQFSGAPQTYSPGTYGNVYQAGSVAAASPYPNNYVPTDYGKTFDAIAKGGMAIGAAGRDIGGYRSEKAMGKVAEKIARDKAFQITQAGLKAASRARAITGAQGRTGEGSPLFAELVSKRLLPTPGPPDTRAMSRSIRPGERAKKYLYKAPADVLTALMGGSSLFKDKSPKSIIDALLEGSSLFKEK